MTNVPTLPERILQAIETAPEPGARPTTLNYAGLARFNVAAALKELPSTASNSEIYQRALYGVNETFNDQLILRSIKPIAQLRDRMITLIQRVLEIKPEETSSTEEEEAVEV